MWEYGYHPLRESGHYYPGNIHDLSQRPRYLNDEINKELEELGIEGWELVSVVMKPDKGTGYLEYVGFFKRKVGRTMTTDSDIAEVINVTLYGKNWRMMYDVEEQKEMLHTNHRIIAAVRPLLAEQCAKIAEDPKLDRPLADGLHVASRIAAAIRQSVNPRASHETCS